MKIYRIGEREPVFPAAGEYWIASEAVVAGKVIRELEDSVIQSMSRSAQKYQAKWRQYSKDLEAIT